MGRPGVRGLCQRDHHFLVVHAYSVEFLVMRAQVLQPRDGTGELRVEEFVFIHLPRLDQLPTESMQCEEYDLNVLCRMLP